MDRQHLDPALLAPPADVDRGDPDLVLIEQQALEVPGRAEVVHVRVAERRIVDFLPREISAVARREHGHEAREARARAPARSRIVREPGSSHRGGRDLRDRERQRRAARAGRQRRPRARHDPRHDVELAFVASAGRRVAIVIRAIVAAGLRIAIARHHDHRCLRSGRSGPRREHREQHDHRERHQPPRHPRLVMPLRHPLERVRTIQLVEAMK